MARAERIFDKYALPSFASLTHSARSRSTDAIRSAKSVTDACADDGSDLSGQSHRLDAFAFDDVW
jgi:hypothetical protein